MYCYQMVIDWREKGEITKSDQQNVLMETYDDQTNIVHVENGDQMSKSLKLV